MSKAANDLPDDFPEDIERIHDLKLQNHHFAKLYDAYTEINRTIHRIETRVEPTDEETEEKLKRRRLQIKDEIMAMLDNKNA